MKKYLVGGVVIALSVAGLVTTVTFAQTAPVSVPASSGPVMVSINPNGSVLLRGSIESVGTDSLVIKSWGGSWTVKITGSTKILSRNGALSAFEVGSFAGVLGSIAQDGSFTVNAEIVRAWGQRSDNDKDGIPDAQDNDDDNDGKLDVNEQGKSNDHDDDGIDDAQDQDDDNDGILDVNEAGLASDHDNDGKADAQDSDDDNDGVLDVNETGKANDHDNDGIADAQDQDDDNDGVADANDTKPLDRDNDGENDDVDQND